MEIIIDDIKINYIDEGIGQNILLLHGWGANIETMLPIFNILKSKCRVVALDMPGFGNSDNPKRPWNSFDYANFIVKFIKKLELNDIILFGHSHGGRVSVIISAENQNLIKKLILIDSAGIKPKRRFMYYFKIYKYKLLKRLYKLIYHADSIKLEKFYKKYGSTDYKNSTGVMRETIVKVLNDNIEPLLEKIDVPTLIIWGENDIDTPIYMAKIFQRKIKNSGLVVLENSKHFSYVDCYGKFKLVIESFLRDDYYKI